MKRRSLYFTGPGRLELREERPAVPAHGEVVVRSIVSGISAGTEMLFYRGQVPGNIPVDESIHGMGGTFRYPLKYGYMTVGTVVERGSGVPPSWSGKTVSVLHPHEDFFTARMEDAVLLPEGLDPEDAVFLPVMDTAATFILDGRPLLGERVAVFGQGVVGLLTTALLSRFPLSFLVTVDPCPLRREHSRGLGAHASIEPGDGRVGAVLTERSLSPYADLVYELSGDPGTLNAAVGAAGFGGRVVVGSWYGLKNAAVDFGGHFHRNRITITSSQVSTIGPELAGRWTRERRLSAAVEMLQAVKPSRLITHRVPFDRAPEAFRLLDAAPEDVLQVVLTFD